MRALFSFLLLLIAMPALAQDHWLKTQIPALDGTIRTFNNLAIEGPSTVWLASESVVGLTRWDNGSVTYVNASNSNSFSDLIFDIAYHDNKLWSLTSNGLVSYDGNEFQLESTTIGALFVDENDQLWATDGNDLLIYANGSFSVFHHHSAPIQGFTIDKNGTAWFLDALIISAQQSLYRFDGTTVESIHAIDIDPSSQGILVRDIDTGDGKLILGTANGYYRFDGSWTWVNEASGLSQGAVSLAEIDDIGNSWAVQSIYQGPPEGSVIYRESNTLELFNFSSDGIQILDITVREGIFYGCGSDGSLFIVDTDVETFSDHATLDVNNVRAQFYAHGSHCNLGPEVDGSNFELNPGDSTFTTFAFSPLIGAKSGNDLFASGAIFNTDFEAGPLSESKTVHRPAILKITQQEIDDHLDNFDAPKYVVPSNILQYPGNGQVRYGEPMDMAPFVDANGNGYYDPANGDYPVIRGDQSIFHTFHDDKIKASLSKGLPSGIEVQCLIYGYDEPSNPALDNSIFFRYTLINRSGRNYDSVALGLFIDFDLGNNNDDFIGSNPNKNTFYVYNGDGFDEDGWNTGFGANPPAVGLKFLSDPLFSFHFWQGANDGRSSPTTDQGIWNYLNAKWGNGLPISYGGSGYDPVNPNPTLVNHMFDGDPVTNTGWTETNVGNNPADRRGFGTFPVTDLADGERVSFDLVWSASQQGGDNLSNITSLFDDQDDVADFFANQTFEEGELASTRAPFTVGIAKATDASVRVFPNPSHGQIFIQAGAPILEVKLSDAHGRVISAEVLSRGSSSELTISPSLENGLYFLTVKTDAGTSETQKVFLLR